MVYVFAQHDRGSAICDTASDIIADLLVSYGASSNQLVVIVDMLPVPAVRIYDPCKTRNDDVTDALRLGLFSGGVAEPNWSEQHAVYLLETIHTERRRRNAVDVSRIDLHQDLSHGVRRAMVAFIHNDHSIGFQPAVELSLLLQRAGHGDVDDAGRCVLGALNQTDVAFSSLHAARWCRILGELLVDIEENLE